MTVLPKFYICLNSLTVSYLSMINYKSSHGKEICIAALPRGTRTKPFLQKRARSTCLCVWMCVQIIVAPRAIASWFNSLAERTLHAVQSKNSR